MHPLTILPASEKHNVPRYFINTAELGSTGEDVPAWESGSSAFTFAGTEPPLHKDSFPKEVILNSWHYCRVVNVFLVLCELRRVHLCIVVINIHSIDSTASTSYIRWKI